MFSGNNLANFRATTKRDVPISNRKTCHRCGQHKDPTNGTTVKLSALSSKRVFVCRACLA